METENKETEVETPEVETPEVETPEAQEAQVDPQLELDNRKMRVILASMGVDVDAELDYVGGLSIVDGEVTGEGKYRPDAATAPAPKKRAGTRKRAATKTPQESAREVVNRHRKSRGLKPYEYN